MNGRSGAIEKRSFGAANRGPFSDVAILTTGSGGLFQNFVRGGRTRPGTGRLFGNFCEFEYICRIATAVCTALR